MKIELLYTFDDCYEYWYEVSPKDARSAAESFSGKPPKDDDEVEELFDANEDYFHDYFKEFAEEECKNGDEYIAWQKDNEELARDPYGFYGVSRSWFN